MTREDAIKKLVGFESTYKELKYMIEVFFFVAMILF